MSSNCLRGDECCELCAPCEKEREELAAMALRDQADLKFAVQMLINAGEPYNDWERSAPNRRFWEIKKRLGL